MHTHPGHPDISGVRLAPAGGSAAVVLAFALALPAGWAFLAGCDSREAGSAGDNDAAVRETPAGDHPPGPAAEPFGPATDREPAGPPAGGAGPPAEAPARPSAGNGPPPSSDPPSAAGGSDVPPFHPLADAAVGEWAEYKALSGRRLRYEIVRAGSETVSTQVTVWAEGGRLGLPAVREDRRDADPVAEMSGRRSCLRSAAPARIEVAGRSWEALLYEDRWSDEEVDYIRRTWVSPAVPVFGLLRMELDGDGRREAELLLTAWGDPSP